MNPVQDFGQKGHVVNVNVAMVFQVLDEVRRLRQVPALGDEITAQESHQFDVLTGDVLADVVQKELKLMVAHHI